VYSGPINVNATETIQAIATATNYSQSLVASATYTILPLAAAPIFSLAPGSYTSAQTLSMTDTTPSAVIRYTTDGTPPTIYSTIYSTPISVSSTETIQAIALASGYSNSPVTSASYTVTLPAATPTFSVPPGSYAGPITVTISDATKGATIVYNTDGVTWTIYRGPITVSATETLQAGAFAVGYSDSAVASATYTIMTTPAITWTPPAPITYGTPLSAAQLNATSSVAGTFSYSPAAGTVLGAGSRTLTVTFAPTDTMDYTTASASVPLTVNKAAPTLTWAPPVPISYGTALSATQLNASSTVPGTFSYSPVAGTILAAGSQTLTVTFTPTDTTDYATSTASVPLTVNKSTPLLSWANPPAITYGTALNAAQLDATANVPGKFSYVPAAGTVLGAGLQTLIATFTPSDGADYTTASKSVTLTVNKATPVVSWLTPSPITYGTALSGAQLNATASVPGAFVYSPAAGALPPVGTDTLNVTFTPTDSNDYATATSSVMLTVNPAPGFSLTASPANLSITQGSSTTTNIAVNPVGGFAGTVKLAVTGLPNGVTASFSTNPTAKTSLLTLKAAAKSTTGTVAVIVTGTSGSLVQSVSLSVTILPRK
jgi:hypothetical protein